MESARTAEAVRRGKGYSRQQLDPIWIPHPKQRTALSCPSFELFFGGAKGGGKSDFLLNDYLQGVPEYGRSWRGIIFRRTYGELDEIIFRSHEIFEKIKGARYVGGDQKTWYIPSSSKEFPGNATLRLRALNSVLDLKKYNGHQYPWMGWDEITEFESDEEYIFMIGCCRSGKLPPNVRYIRATGNPGRPGHVWVKQRFVDITEPGMIYKDPLTGSTRCFISSRLEDNDALMKNDPEYGNRLKLLPEHLQKALRWGDWEVVVGQVLSEYRRERHIIPTRPLGEGWYRFCSMDWGFAKPFSIGWYAVNEEGRAIRYKEFYGSEGKLHNTGIRMAAKDVAARAWEMSVHEGVTVMVADPACWIKGVDEDVPSIQEYFASAGFEMVRANNDRHTGLIALHDLMMTDGHDGRPMFLVTDICHHWMRTVPYLTPDPRDPEDINTALEDHAYDETRYAIMSEYVRNPRALRRRQAYNPTIMPRNTTYDPLRQGL